MPAIVHAEINLDALAHNIKIIRQLAPHAKILAMIKANAYGHDIVKIARVLAPLADGLGVARLTEALVLHEQGINIPIFILDGFFTQAELQETMKDHFIAVINNIEQVQLLEKVELREPIKAWIKINTGMNRLGFRPENFPAIYTRLIDCKNVQQPIGQIMHFACADDKESPMNQAQIELFWHTVKSYPGDKSLANSAAIINFPDTHADWIRPGIMLFGASPLIEKTGAELGLKPVMTLTSELIAINPVHRGDQIGYGATYVCEEDTRIGIVAIGYGDGYPRNIKPNTPVLINGHYAPIAGRVSMDMLTVDLKNHPDAKVGDKVTLWGEGLPIEIIAQNAETIPYELLCRVKQTPDRVTYIYKESTPDES